MGHEGQGRTFADLVWSTLVAPDTASHATIAPLDSPSIEVEPAVRDQGSEVRAGQDYELREELGRGGMGVVLRARQTALDRDVAVKLLHGEALADSRKRRRFLAEAALTGALEHPNIVPVHDLGTSPEGELFYSMKLIQGRAWAEELPHLGLDENVRVLLEVCDAVAFAHAQGILHRDLKPHNVMLGAYGEVLVVDWGLALRLDEQGRAPADAPMGGTACYMAPETARCQAQELGPRSDVYLLGAILWEILTGAPPHLGSTALECLESARDNALDVPDSPDELTRIALRALATRPSERTPTVADFSAELRAWQGHSASLTLSREARALLDRASDYADFTRALHGFEQALALWPDNPGALEGQRRTRLVHARAALGRQDLDLAASLLDASEPEDAALLQEVERARTERAGRARRLRSLTWVAGGLAVVVVVVVVVGVVATVRQRDRALEAEDLAAQQRDLALHTLDTLVYEVDAELSRRPAMAELRQTLLDEAMAGLDQVVLPEGEQADARLASAHQSMARILHAARRAEEAEAHQRAALSLLQAQEPRDVLALAEAHLLLGDILGDFRMGDLQQAHDHYQIALEVLEAAPSSAETRVLRTSAELSLGDALVDLEQEDQAMECYQRALHRTQGQPGLEARHYDLLQRLGDLTLEHRPEEALALYQAALSLAEEAESDRPWQRREGLASFSLAAAHEALGQPDQARAHYAAALELQSTLVALDSTDGQAQRDLLVTHWALGDLQRSLGDLDGALDHYTHAQERARLLLSMNPANAEAQRDLFVCLNRGGDVRLALSDPAAATEAYTQGLALSAALRQEHPDQLVAWTDEAVSHFKLGDAAPTPAEARVHYQRSLDLLREARDAGLLTESSRFWPWLEEVEAELQEAAP